MDRVNGCKGCKYRAPVFEDIITCFYSYCVRCSRWYLDKSTAEQYEDLYKKKEETDD